MPLYDYESDRALERSQSDVERANPSLVCPITAELFRDPVLCVGDGYTYEREAAEKWFADGKTTSPMTGAELPESQRRLVPNFNVRTRADQARGGAPKDGSASTISASTSRTSPRTTRGPGCPGQVPSRRSIPRPRRARAAFRAQRIGRVRRQDTHVGTYWYVARRRCGQGARRPNQRDASRAVPYDGSHVYVISSDGKYLTDPSAKFVSLRATDRPVTGSEWIFKKSGERVAFKSVAARFREYDHAHFNNHGHGRVEMWTKGGDAGHFTLHVDSGGVLS